VSGPAGQTWFHVTSVRNRDLIRKHGLDVSRMGVVPGIAGSTVPEQDGVFLAPDRWTTDYFVGMNNTGGPVDVWEVRGIDPAELVTSPEGYQFLPSVVPPGRLSLLRQDIPSTDPFSS
jgi:hypothetical protein